MLSIGERKNRAVALVMCVVIAVLASSLILSGCGSNTPQGAMQKLLDAWQNGDWNAYKSAVAPKDRNLSKEQEDLAKQKFDQIKVKFSDVKTRTDFDKKDKNLATVTFTGGKITITADILGEKKTQTSNLAMTDKNGKALPESQWPAVRVNGVWYIDRPLGL